MNEPSSRVFLSTDAGSTGLNLQSAATIINIDLPWNPAVLEQRIGRIYRLGQQNNIQVINLVTPDSIEQEMLGKLRFKTSMFEGVLDDGEDSVFITDDKFSKMMETVSGMVEEDEETEKVKKVKDTDTVMIQKVRQKSQRPRKTLQLSILRIWKQTRLAMNINLTRKERVPSSSKRTHLRTENPSLIAQVSQRIW